MTQTARPAAAVKSFTITFHIGPDEYAVVPLHPDPAVARKAYRLRKRTGDEAVYDVALLDHGAQCECLGFLRWGHCKHIRTLQAAGMLAG